MDLVRRLAEQCLSHGQSLVTAESCTGGGLAYQLTSLAGSSGWYERGFVTYSNLSKQQCLGVKPGLLAEYGAVSEQVAIAMAVGALTHSQADLSLSITGIAGPDGGAADKPVGLVWFGLASKRKPPLAAKKIFSGDRHHIRQQAISYALSLLLQGHDA